MGLFESGLFFDHGLGPWEADHRYYQRYCVEAACRHASKAASQRHWQAKAENRDYFRDPLHVP